MLHQRPVATSTGYELLQDRVNCPFYLKIGACRNGDRCNRADKVLAKPDNISEVSKTSKSSFLRRPSSFLMASKEEEQHVLMVMTRPAKTFELLCSSAMEAVTWFEALKTAIAMDRNDAEAHTTAPSEEERPKGGGYPGRPGASAGDM
eukprot:Skav231439  [mRNA]  locus=scaffold1847:230236:246336:+ [translate_table: standard]